jgi:uncharacterized SAM-binding protein YcdF (DUF218 family)
MFFIISKVLSFLLNPISWVTITLILALISSKPVRRKRFLWSSLIIVLVFGNSFLVDEVLRSWESEAIKLNKSEQFDYGVVLSGMTIWDKKFHRLNFHGNVDRLLQSLPGHQSGIIDSLILSGGDGSAFQNDVKESDALLMYLKSINFNTKKIIVESASKNTHENASFTKDLLEEKGVEIKSKKVLLITSALHMKRSLACFKKQGIECTPYSTNRMSGPRKYIFDHLFIPNPGAMHVWKAFLHEVIGFVIYSIMGYI